MTVITMEEIAIESREMLKPLWRKYNLPPPHVQIYKDVLKDKHVCQFAFAKGKVECDIDISNGLDIQIPPDIEDKLQAMIKEQEALLHRKPFVRLEKSND